MQLELERQLKEAEAVREGFIRNGHVQIKARLIDFHVGKKNVKMLAL